MKAKSKQNKQPLAILAYETIVKRIICLEYEPSQHLEEGQLVEELGIGRTPVREALVRLQGERMVESHPNKGVVVRPITLQNTKAMFESMNIFEFGVADIAVTKDCSRPIKKMEAANKEIQAAIETNDHFAMVEANHDFHMYFARCSQNEFLIRSIQDVRNEAKRLSFLSYNMVREPEPHYENVVMEHEKMMTCLENRDAPGLKSLLVDHIQTFRDRIIRFMVS